MIEFLLNKFKENPKSNFMIWKDREFSYLWLYKKVNEFRDEFGKIITEGSVIALTGDFTPTGIALFLAFTDLKYIIVPMTKQNNKNKEDLYTIAEVEYKVTVDENDNYSILHTNKHAIHDFYKIIRERNNPGLVLFTSGTSGVPKAAVHDFSNLLEKFKTPRKSNRTINFLLFDHWGGLNTMLHSLSNISSIIAVKDRSPDNICEVIEKHNVDILPASPTFLNLLLISEAYKRYDMSSLKIITYGTEPMPESLLMKLNKVFPNVIIQQTYGLIEVGVLRAKSKSNNSLWVKIGGEGFETRVVDDILQIKAKSAMLGYINAESPFTEDGWFITGDAVEVDGEFFKILGRKSELINVGGEKVYPAEIESIIIEYPGVTDVTVYGEKNLLTGNIVCAKINITEETDDIKYFITELKRYCRERMRSFMIPVKIYVVKEELHNARYKKVRSGK